MQALENENEIPTQPFQIFQCFIILLNLFLCCHIGRQIEFDHRRIGWWLFLWVYACVGSRTRHDVAFKTNTAVSHSLASCKTTKMPNKRPGRGTFCYIPDAGRLHKVGLWVHLLTQNLPCSGFSTSLMLVQCLFLWISLTFGWIYLKILLF